MHPMRSIINRVTESQSRVTESDNVKSDFVAGFHHGYLGKPKSPKMSEHYNNGHAHGRSKKQDDEENDEYSSTDVAANAHHAHKEYMS